MINKYTYNEKLYAETIEKHGFQSKFLKYEIIIMCKYFRSLGNTRSQTKDLIYKFCEDNLLGFRRENYFQIINRALEISGKKNNKLIVIESVKISDKEMSYIKDLSTSDENKKVTLALLVKNKLERSKQIINNGKYEGFNYFSGNKAQYGELHKMANLPSKCKINDCIYELDELGVVEAKMKGKIKLKFIEEIEESNKCDLEIKQFWNIGLYFDKFNDNKKVRECDVCDELFKINSNRNKYCKECAKKIFNEQCKLNMQKIRENKNVIN